MRINYTLNSENIIINWTKVPFDASKSFIELPDNTVIHSGFDKIINGQFIAGISEYNQAKEALYSKISKQELILSYKQYLADSDYKLAKFLEGELTEEEYAPIKAQRKEWRAEINRLEGELK